MNVDKNGISIAELKARIDELRLKIDDLRSKMVLRSPSEMKTATENSVRGFIAVLLGEKAFRTDVVVFAVCTPIALLIPGLSPCERAVMIYTVFMVLMCEIVNTAIETVVDRISTDFNELSGRAKDIGSALVFAAFFGAGIVWAVILVYWALRFFGK